MAASISEKSAENSRGSQGKAVTRSSKHHLAHSNGTNVEQKKDASSNPDKTSSGSISISDGGGYDTIAASDAASFPSSVTSDSINLSLKIQTMETLISSLFSTVSSLKNAYLQLQSAHVPYDRLKIQIADMAIVHEFKRMSELKRSYKDKMAAIANCSSSSSSSSSSSPSSCLRQNGSEMPVGDENSKVSRSEMLQNQKRRDEDSISSSKTGKGEPRSGTEGRQEMLAKTKLKKEKLERRLKQLEARLQTNGNLAAGGNRKPAVSSSPTVELLEEAVLSVSECSRSFAKVLIALMKAANWDVVAAADAIEAGVTYARESHTKFAIESYVNHRMLNGFDSASFHGDDNGASSASQSREQRFKEYRELLQSKAMDPFELMDADPQGSFAMYCRKRFADVVHPKMEESFFGDMSHGKQISECRHPTSHLYASFLSLAMEMWMLHRLAYCFEPPAQIFTAERGVGFSPLYMESIVQSMDFAGSHGEAAKVAFTVMPGFRVQGTVIKCQVYIHKSHHI